MQVIIAIDGNFWSPRQYFQQDWRTRPLKAQIKSKLSATAQHKLRALRGSPCLFDSVARRVCSCATGCRFSQIAVPSTIAVRYYVNEHLTQLLIAFSAPLAHFFYCPMSGIRRVNDRRTSFKKKKTTMPFLLIRKCRSLLVIRAAANKLPANTLKEKKINKFLLPP